MKRKQVNKILNFQKIRHKNVFLFIVAISINILIAMIFLLLYINGNKYQYIKYTEQNNTTYKVYLKENDFFNKDYLLKDNEYISTLINNIEANFDYFLSVEEDVTYNYSYKIESNVYAKRKSSSEYLYNETTTIIDKVEKTTNENNIKINKNLNIDYNMYNNLMKKFVNIYSLEDIESVLTINMYINVVGACNEFSEETQKDTVLSVKIPLTTRVVDIELRDNLLNNQNNLIECKKTIENAAIFLILSLIFTISSTIIIILMIKYIIKTRTAENIYQKEMKKILNNYGSYIQTLGNSIDLTNYQLLHIDSFTDLLEISETIRLPILLKENNEKTGAYFLILTSFGTIYIYRLKVSDIEKNIKN